MPITEGGKFTPHDRIVSPGVFSRENDLSTLPQGIADIGGVIIAPFEKGPGFTPTLVRSISEFENKFGTPNGKLYGPYSAEQYIQERGLVTVCRVGGLTGYHQKYPVVLYAEKGTWNRNGDTGSIASGSSYLYPNGSTDARNVTSSVTINSFFKSASGTVTSITGSISFTSSFSILFGGVAATDPATSFATALLGTTGGSGSLVYNSQRVSLNNSILTVNFSGSYTSQSGETNLDSIRLAISSGSFTGSFGSCIATGSAPFNDTTYNAVVYSHFSTVRDLCNFPIFVFKYGAVQGLFGGYNGAFTPNGTPTFDACTNQWTASTADWKVLGVLANTQYNPLNSSLQASGFSGSVFSYDSQVTKSVAEINDQFYLTLQSTDSTSPYGTYRFSIDPSNIRYISNIFGNDPLAGDPDKYIAGSKLDAAYTYKLFEDSIATVFANKVNWRISASVLPASAAGFSGEPMKFVDDYSLDLLNGDSGFSLTNASTPWIVSQKISPWTGSNGVGSTVRYPLFKVHTLSDGTITNKSYKVEISNVKLAGTVSGTDWGTFTLNVRKYSDSDRKPVILETFQNLTLDPDSANYIARRIGDKYAFINFAGKITEYGTFTNVSKYIRIEMSSNNYPVSSVPYGFQALSTPIDGGIGFWSPQIKYSKASVYSLFPGKYPSGMVFDDAPAGADAELNSLYPTSSTGIGVSNDTKQYLAPLPTYSSTLSVGRNSIFALDENITDGGVSTGEFFTSDNIIPAVYNAASETTYVKMRKFVVGFQGGFDGASPAIPLNLGSDIIPGNTQGVDCTNSTTAGSIAYKQCIGALSNADEFDVNLIWLPGIVHQYHPYVTQLAVDMCENRGDCFYIMDLYAIPNTEGQTGLIDEVVSFADAYDTNYAAAYYPWVKILDNTTNKIISVPPSVVLPAVYAQSDRLGAEWFAPAGLNRGGIVQAVQVCDRVTHSERDTLYEGRVNPIAAFPGVGISVWGQKTLQVADSALNRINVRRLIINLKKFIASTSRYLLFEQNVASTRNKFLSIVNPYMESVQQRSGLYAFQVVMDESNNTPDIIDQNIMYGQIWLKPTKTSEFLVVDFNILSTGASFPNS